MSRDFQIRNFVVEDKSRFDYLLEFIDERERERELWAIVCKVDQNTPPQFDLNLLDVGLLFRNPQRNRERESVCDRSRNSEVSREGFSLTLQLFENDRPFL